MAINVVHSEGFGLYGPTVDFTVPASAQSNDRVVCFVSTTRWPNPESNYPASLTHFGTHLSGTGNSLDTKVGVFVGVVGQNGLAANDILSIGNGSDNNHSGVMVVLRADDGSVPQYDEANNVGGLFDGMPHPGGSSPTAPSVSLPEDGLLLFVTSVGHDVTSTPPSGYTTVDEGSRTGSSVYVAERDATAGLSGGASSSISAAGSWNAGHMLFWQEAGASDTVDPEVFIDSVHPSGQFQSVFQGYSYDPEGNVLTLTGNASDNAEVSIVEVRVDNGPWLAATGTTDWTIEFDLDGWFAGPHIVEARAVDSSNNESEIDSWTVWYSPDSAWGFNAVGQKGAPLGILLYGGGGGVASLYYEREDESGYFERADATGYYERDT